MAKSYNLFFQDKHYGRYQFDGETITVAEAIDEKHEGIMADFIEELRDIDQTDADLWKELPKRLAGRYHLGTIQGEPKDAA